jgi:hypothetical protein
MEIDTSDGRERRLGSRALEPSPNCLLLVCAEKIVVEEIELGQLMHTMKTRNQRRRLGCASGRARKTRRICSVRLQRRLDPAQRSMVWRRQAEREDAADGGSPEIGWR